MRQVFRIGITVWTLLVFLAGCSAVDWFRQKMSASKETDSAGSSSAPAPADGKVRGTVQTFNVQFGLNRWDLDNTAQTTLLVLTKKLRENPKLTVELEGYADSVGSHDYNLRLTQKRVEVVRRYLVDRGVEQARIQAAGVGQLPDGGTPDERAKNRRVTVKLMAIKK